MSRPKKVVVEDIKDDEVVISSPVVSLEVELYQGKKVVSSKEVEINGKKYKEIIIEDGSTYTI